VRFHIGLASDGGDASAWLEWASSDSQDAVDQALALEGAVHQAIALESAMGLLHALQAWIEPSIVRVEPAPAPPPWPAPDQALTLGVTDGGRLALPWAAVRAGRVLDAAPHVIEWPLLACELVLETLAQERIDASAIERGGVLLLPGTLASTDAPPVPTTLMARPLHAPDLPPLGGLAWDACAGTLRLAQAAVCEPTTAAWEVMAEPPIELSAQWWFNGAAPAQDLPPPARAALRLHGRAVARGALVPAGRGLGLLIEACEATLPPLQAA
jgi:hypothetical protein